MRSTVYAGVLLRPFFTKILAWTTFVHFSNPGAKNPSLDEFLGIYTLYPASGPHEVYGRQPPCAEGTPEEALVVLK